MSLTRRRFTQGLVSALAVGMIPLRPAAANLIEGRDWRPISPHQPRTNPDKIDVIEFFSYGCPHCMDLNPSIKGWAADLPDDVSFRRIPVSFGRAAWANLARLYFALDYSGDLDRLDQAVFEALHRDRARLYTEKAIFDWLADKGVDTDAFASLFNSFAVETQLKRGEALVERYRVDAVPMITVDGRYVVVGREAKGFPELLAIADDVILMARNQAATG
ncbi:MAG: thiol:disulfide interchange protein DsbA/DsbL [Thiocapsa sp.]|jgi:thiol:disulfide interchange protein DsbA|nr:thiol:disulfide interchange protein DsbA/DsbL [Thiocapsa sp.]MCG6896694.1 thiol:disulfide interchange protein DsbA/DsbL [Thiocapsa sp.]MCG6983856.1 thiol:disulfide interchange protein DsbA/DsbL [Thiocapsa sp.]